MAMRNASQAMASTIGWKFPLLIKVWSCRETSGLSAAGIELDQHGVPGVRGVLAERPWTWGTTRNERASCTDSRNARLEQVAALQQVPDVIGRCRLPWDGLCARRPQDAGSTGWPRSPPLRRAAATSAAAAARSARETTSASMADGDPIGRDRAPVRPYRRVLAVLMPACCSASPPGSSSPVILCPPPADRDLGYRRHHLDVGCPDGPDLGDEWVDAGVQHGGQRFSGRWGGARAATGDPIEPNRQRSTYQWCGQRADRDWHCET